eukprot:155097-Pleurochrysis_carterae.AAC.1
MLRSGTFISPVVGDWRSQRCSCDGKPSAATLLLGWNAYALRANVSTLRGVTQSRCAFQWWSGGPA